MITFGPFTLIANERLLLRENVPVQLGARAFDILVTLAMRPNEVIGKKELLARVWPDIIVEEGSLRFHVANLRKALGDGKDGARYISTLAGRGYCFVAPIARPSDRADAETEVAVTYPQANLPSRLIRIVGRTDDVATLSAQLAAVRFVTIVGAGGVGKTTVAVAVGHDLIEAFAGSVHFVDLGALSDPDLLVTTLASTLGLSVQADNSTQSLIAYLKDKRILLILDTCEHLVEAAAALASRIFATAPQVHILATSQEALRVEGEHVYKLAPLAYPPDDRGLSAARALTFPAAQLFLERIAAGGARIDLNDRDAAIVGSICRKLDGVPLAIELAAGRVEGYGLQKIAELLDQHLTLLWPGQRTAPPRQQTLQATLDWSYGLLSDTERAVLRRLAVFVGHFTIEAALEVVTGGSIDESTFFGTIDSLVAKSMVASRPAGAMMRYRLLDATRAYAFQIGVAEPELGDVAARHAAYCLRWLEETGTEWPSLASAAQRALHLTGLANVRAALDWCFGPNGNAQTGVRLAAAAAPVFLIMSLLTECHRWSERAIASFDETTRGDREEMHLQAALGVSLMLTRGGNDAARVALERSVAIAEQLGDALNQLQALGPLELFHLRTGQFKTALEYADRCSVIARAHEDPVAAALAHPLMGIALHFGGELDRARAELEAALRSGRRSLWTTTVYLGFDGKVLAGTILARTLWLQGHPAQAAERARLTVSDAAAMEHPMTLSVALVSAVSVFLWTGDFQSADEHIDWLVSCAEPDSLRTYLAFGRGFKGELAIRRGDASAGVASLEACLDELHAARHESLSTPLTISLVQGLAATDRHAEALTLIDATIQSVEANGDLCYMPELLRMKGNLALAAPQAVVDEPETYFRRSLELSRHQGARAWELRAAIDLASLLAARGEPRSARAFLQPVFEQFTEGSDTADLKSTAHLLKKLS